MTALDTIEARVTFVDRLAEHIDTANALAADLDLMQYADVSKLGADRGLLHLGAKFAGEVMSTVAGLGDDPEARD